MRRSFPLAAFSVLAFMLAPSPDRVHASDAEGDPATSVQPSAGFDWKGWSSVVQRQDPETSVEEGRSTSPYFVSRDAIPVGRDQTIIPGQASVRRWGESDMLEDPVRVKRHWTERLDPERGHAVIDGHVGGPEEPALRADSVGSWQRVLGGIRTGTPSRYFAGRMTKSAFTFDHALGYRTTYAGSSSGGLWKVVVAGTIPLWVPVSDRLPGSPAVGGGLNSETQHPYGA